MSGARLPRGHIVQLVLHLSPRAGLGRALHTESWRLFPSSSARRTHRPISIHSFRQSYETKSEHAHQAFFQEFEVSPVSPSTPRREDQGI